jgi:hypothetical protein
MDHHGPAQKAAMLLRIAGRGAGQRIDAQRAAPIRSIPTSARIMPGDGERTTGPRWRCWRPTP